MSKFVCPTNSPRNNFSYSINWIDFMVTILPISRRKEKIIAWLGIIFKEISFIYQAFLSTRCSTLLKTAVNNQKIVLEEGLNQKFDPINKGIVIVNKASLIDTLTVYNEDESVPVGENVFVYNEDENIDLVKQVYIYNDDEIELTEDFIVELPAGLFVTTEAIKSYVELYRPVGTTYTVIFK